MWAKGDICHERDVISTEGVLLAQQVFLAIHTDTDQQVKHSRSSIKLYTFMCSSSIKNTQIEEKFG